VDVVATNAPQRMVQDPGHPHADAQGYVRYPGVDQAAEMITAMTALRTYEANVAAMGFARAMAARALDIGGSR
jgi:flagellar basal-body rod protein FlgC